jgi:hypothetical protein
MHGTAAHRTVRVDAAVGELSALGPAGGARGVHHEADVVRIHAPALVGLPGREERLVFVVPADDDLPRDEGARAGCPRNSVNWSPWKRITGRESSRM